MPSEAHLITSAYNIIVDALFGCGFRGPTPQPDMAAVIQTMIKSSVPIASIDVPSGQYPQCAVFISAGLMSLAPRIFIYQHQRLQKYVGSEKLRMLECFPARKPLSELLLVVASNRGILLTVSEYVSAKAQNC